MITFAHTQLFMALRGVIRAVESSLRAEAGPPGLEQESAFGTRGTEKHRSDTYFPPLDPSQAENASKGKF
jgi:hypothetical protein